MGNGRDFSQQILNAALKYAGDAALVPALRLEPELARLREYIGRGLPEGLAYLARKPEERADITSWSSPAKTVLVMLFGYHNTAMESVPAAMPRAKWEKLKQLRGSKLLPPPPPGDPVAVARYALCADYHVTVKNLLKQTLEDIRRFAPKTKGRVFVDTSPVFEKALAVRAGLGFYGRNTLVINPKLGSYFVIGGIALHAELDFEPRPATPPGCGDCRRCETKCPGGALANNTLNPARCLSYWTTAQTQPVAPATVPLLNGRVQGCDICQQCCPHNKNLTAPVRDEFLPLKV